MQMNGMLESLKLQLLRHPPLMTMSASVFKKSAKNAPLVRPARSHFLCLWNVQSVPFARHVHRATAHSARSVNSAQTQLRT